MSGLVKAAISFMATKYQASVAASCASYGLRYQDLLIEREDVEKALDRVDSTVRIERERRIKRAFDASAKKKLLPTENQTKNPLEPYLTEQLKRAELDRQERAILNGY